MEGKRYVRVHGELIEVTEEVYYCYYSMARKERTLTEKDARNRVSSYDGWDTGTLCGAEMIKDTAALPEAAVINKIMLQKLRKCLTELSEKERDLIRALFFEEKTVTQLAQELKIPRRTLGYRIDCTVKKLKKLMKS